MDDHTAEPGWNNYRKDGGEYIGDDAADCVYCGREINGNENGWYHVEDED